jgi:integrase
MGGIVLRLISLRRTTIRALSLRFAESGIALAECLFARCRPGRRSVGFWNPANFRYRVLKPLQEALELPKLTFQVLRRTIATRAQKLGSVKDVQSHLRHSRADTTANEYMQELPESVQQMAGTVYAMLTLTAT